MRNWLTATIRMTTVCHGRNMSDGNRNVCVRCCASSNRPARFFTIINGECKAGEMKTRGTLSGAAIFRCGKSSFGNAAAGLISIPAIFCRLTKCFISLPRRSFASRRVPTKWAMYGKYRKARSAIRIPPRFQPNWHEDVSVRHRAKS